MGLFEGMLKGDESLFLESIALDFDYQPKMVPHRENQQHFIAQCIKPLFSQRNGKNLIISGLPGIGKTVCLKHVLRELQQETDDIYCIFINCWKKESPFKIVTQICEDLGYTWTHNKSYEDLYKKAIELLNKKSSVIVLDEADRINDQKIIYSILEDVFRKVLIMITNKNDLESSIDHRVKSRLLPDNLSFEPYAYSQVKDILLQRREYAFVKGVWEEEAFEMIVSESFNSKDVRKGLFLMKSAGENAENRASKKIQVEDVEFALGKEKPSVKEIKKECDEILELVKANPGKSVKDLFELYGKGSYRTFQRRIKDLKDGKMITVEEENKGFEEGKSTSVNIVTLDEF
jgi:cell division control protein 6